LKNLNGKGFQKDWLSNPYFTRIQIARDWNVPASGSGFVTKFSLSATYLSKYKVENVGGPIHNELWVPAEELEEFNDNIIGLIEVTQSFYPADKG